MLAVAALSAGPMAASEPLPRLLVRGATMITMRAGDEDPFEGYLVVGSDGRISAVGRGEPPAGLEAAETLDASGKIMIPGFVSAHSHLWQSAFRGLGPNEWVMGWGGSVRTQADFSRPDDFYWFALHGALDHLRHGVTSIYNFSAGGIAFDPPADQSLAYQVQQLAGALGSGARILHAWSRPRRLSEPDQRRLLADFLSSSAPSAGNPRLLGFSISGVPSPASAVALDAALSRENGFVNETHYLEYPLDVPAQQAYFANFVASHALGPSLFFGHFIHTNDAMLEAVGRAGGGMSWQPLSNGRLASGIADIPRYIRFGLRIGMGLDGQASSDLPDPFGNMRMGLYSIRAKYENGSILKPIDVLRFHTIGSATVMRVDDRVGSLEKGKFADFLLVDTTSVDRGPVYDPYATLVFSCTSENLEGVYVGGRRVSSYARLTEHDFSVVQREVYERVARIRAASGAARRPPSDVPGR